MNAALYLSAVYCKQREAKHNDDRLKKENNPYDCELAFLLIGYLSLSPFSFFPSFVPFMLFFLSSFSLYNLPVSLEHHAFYTGG